MEDKKLFKKVRCVPFSWGTNETNIEIPFGFQFDKIVAIENTYNGGSTTTLYAVMLEETTTQEWAAKNKEYFDSELERHKKYIDEKYAEKIKGLDLLQSFSNLISKFRIGDIACYYTDGTNWGADANLIESHIHAIQIAKIVLATDTIKVEPPTDKESDSLYVVSSSMSAKAIELYKTKEEAIEANKEYHEKYLKIKEDARAKSEAAAKQRKSEEEAEILRKAAEIKAKSTQA